MDNRRRSDVARVDFLCWSATMNITCIITGSMLRQKKLIVELNVKEKKNEVKLEKHSKKYVTDSVQKF